MKRYDLWHFELRGWKQIIGFDLLFLFCVVGAYMAGSEGGGFCR